MLLPRTIVTQQCSFIDCNCHAEHIIAHLLNITLLIWLVIELEEFVNRSVVFLCNCVWCTTCAFRVSMASIHVHVSQKNFTSAITAAFEVADVFYIKDVRQK